MSKSKSPVIVWFRKDLRLDDNAALASALASESPVILLYVRDPDHAGAPLGAAQEWWLHYSLRALAAAIEERGNRLILRHGSVETEVAKLAGEVGASAVFWNRLYDPRSFDRDSALKASLREQGYEAKSFAGQLVHEPSKLRTTTGGPYKVYTPFWRALEKDGEPPEPIDAPEAIAAPDEWPECDDLESWKLLPTKPDWAHTFHEVWTPGEEAAHARLENFIDEDLQDYETARDIPSKRGTSMMAPHLALGEISPARIWHSVRAKRGSADNVIKFRKEIAWRDFCYHLLFHFPDLPTKNWNPRFDGMKWQHNDTLFRSWCEGKTGYPIVDAGMRQLWKHGTMHNRVRMITASFLIKDLLIDWRRGEEWFRDTLVDADPASNAGNWQWVAGSGADASPYYRIFNPIVQGERFDKEGDYVRTFVPELADLDKRYIHKPFEAPKKVLEEAGIELGKTYPLPVVDHAEARARAMDIYTDAVKN